MKLVERIRSLPRPALFAAGAVSVVLLSWLYVRGQGTPVDTAPVSRGQLVQTVLVSGRMANQSRVFLGSTITGRVREVRVREGTPVKAGALLVQLEDAEWRAAAQQAQAAAKSAQARLEGQRKLSGPLAAQQLEQARANAEAAQRERERGESLFRQGFIGQSRLDEVRRLADVAASQLKAAEVQADANLRGAEMEAAVARAAEATAAAELAWAKLEQTRIVAPADGLVLERLAEPGQIVQPGTRLIELSIEGVVELIAQVDEKFLGQLAPGQRAGVVADAFPAQRFQASVKSVAPSIDAQRGSVEVKFSLPALPAFLRNDMTLSIEIETARRADTLSIPGEALRAGNQVLVVEGGRAVAKNVKPGIRTLTAVEVLEGLSAGEIVVLDARAQAGQRVHAGPKPQEAISNLPTDAVKSFGRD